MYCNLWYVSESLNSVLHSHSSVAMVVTMATLNHRYFDQHHLVGASENIYKGDSMQYWNGLCSFLSPWSPLNKLLHVQSLIVEM
jgi:hypothetical protein